MYRIALIDDEPAWLNHVRDMAEESLLNLGIAPFECRTFNNPQLLIAELARGKSFDLVMIDVCLSQNESGVAVARTLRAQYPRIGIILISKHDEYVLDGYDVQALYFFVKPIRQNKLEEIISRDYTRRHGVQPLTFRLTNGQRTALSPEEILYFEHYYGKTRIVCTAGACESPKKLGELIDQLPADQFVQCHQSFIVNLTHVAAIERYKFTLKTGGSVPVSKLYYLQIRDRYEQYLIASVKKKPLLLG